MTASIDHTGQVATILIHRSQPQTLTADILTELERVLPQASSARVVILRNGDKITRVPGRDPRPPAPFCADQAFPQTATTNEAHPWMPLGHRVFDRIAHLAPPTIAVLNGLAIGTGVDLALACDYRIATEDAHAGSCEVGLGTIPGWSGSRRLTQLIGPERATQIRNSTPSLDARTACTWGIFTDITPSGRLDHHLDQLARDVLHLDRSTRQLATDR